VDLGTVAVLALLIILVAVAVLVSRQGLLASPLPALRWQDFVARRRDGEEPQSGPAVGNGDGNVMSADQLATRVSPPSRLTAAAVTPSFVALPPSPKAPYPVSSASSLEPVGTQLERLDTKITELTQTIDRHEAALSALLRQSMTDLAQSAAADGARSDAAVERLRADLLAALAATRASEGRSRRQDVCAELYVTLARFEVALAAVSNPVLLPGEPYAIPEELPASALVWENWNDVGERVFLLADTFNAQRLHLSQQAREDLAQFLTTMRTLLTGTIYSSLQSGAGSSQDLALRHALNQIAQRLLDLRETLEREYEGPYPLS
jgi:hypothetical protein